MAIYHASTKSLSRSDGRSAVASVAYRAGARLTDERTGLVHDYSRRSGVLVAEILTPGAGPADRSELWNAVEAAEKRKDSRTGREWVLALPAELDAEQRHGLARGFALELVRRYGVAVDMAIHEPSRDGDERNHHAHLFATTRSVSRSESGALVLGEKASCELSDSKRRKLGLSAASEEVRELRGLWERLANEALERAGREERITAKSLEAQGIDREPTTHLGPSATAMERRGEPSERGEINRQVEARNAEREAVQAEILDLKAERDRRAKEAQEVREREEAERDRRAKEAQEVREREEAEAQAKAEARQEAARHEEARKEGACDVERWEAMDPMQRRLELMRLRPPSLESLIERDAAMKAAQSRQQEAEARRDLAAQEAQTWRERGRARLARAWLHERGILRSSQLGALERRREEMRTAAEEAARNVERTRKEAADRITEAQKPAQERFAAFREVYDRKAREEALAARREAQARKEAEEQARATQARKEAAEREAARKVDAEREETAKRKRIAAMEEIGKDPAKAQEMRDHIASKFAKLPEGTEREKMRQTLAEFEKVTGTRERSQREIENQKLAEFAQKRWEARQRQKDRGWDRDH